MTIRALLFDLDGTLLDTASDLLYAVNLVRKEYNLPELPLAPFRSFVSGGARGMLGHGFDISDQIAEFTALKEKFLGHYHVHLTRSTQLFPQMEEVLNFVESNGIPWGIVTNKATYSTNEILKALGLHHRPACIVCGDTLDKCKPDPAPILHACEIMQVPAEDCIYVGDAKTDILAGKAAGMKTLVAKYGYIHEDDDPQHWDADGYVESPVDILDWLKAKF